MIAKAFGLAVILLVGGCGAATSEAEWRGEAGSTTPNAAGLVSLPCDGSEPMAPAVSRYCRLDRHFMTPSGRDALVDAGRELANRYPGATLKFMDASGPDGETPFHPHLSHGDGRQIDLALFYETLEGEPMSEFPDMARGGYRAAEPPRPGDPVMCVGINRSGDKPDPPADRNWRLDDERTRALVEILIADPRVRRVLIEPHLERRFGLWGHPKLRFAGCQAARHDDHLHVDFH